jgi:hypothetical protein
MLNIDKFKQYLASDYANLEEEKIFLDKYKHLLDDQTASEHEIVPNSQNYIDQINMNNPFKNLARLSLRKSKLLRETKCILDD